MSVNGDYRFVWALHFSVYRCENGQIWVGEEGDIERREEVEEPVQYKIQASVVLQPNQEVIPLEVYCMVPEPPVGTMWEYALLEWIDQQDWQEAIQSACAGHTLLPYDIPDLPMQWMVAD
jgi:hypothetical protein